MTFAKRIPVQETKGCACKESTGFLLHSLTLVTIAELAGLVGTGGGTGRHNGAVQAGLADEVDLDGRVTARVVYGTGVDLGDGHVDCAGGVSCRSTRKQLEER